MSIRLYNYFRSSASYRVRIGLHLKNIKFEYIPVHLLRDGGQQKSTAHLERNPLAQVPTLDHDGKFISQSMAILFYLDEIQDKPRLFSTDPYTRAKQFEACEIINSGIQPLHNLSVNLAMEKDFHVTKEQTAAWNKFWIEKGLTAFAQTISPFAKKFCFGDEPSGADACLMPQLFTSRRFAVDLNKFPRLLEIEANCSRLESFQLAEPARQIDAE